MTSSTRAPSLINYALDRRREAVTATELAGEWFDQLPAEEVDRLARREFTNLFRAALRRKDSFGVPNYVNVPGFDRHGNETRWYVPSEQLTVEDYRRAAADYAGRSRVFRRVALALIYACERRFGVRISLDDLAQERGAA